MLVHFSKQLLPIINKTVLLVLPLSSSTPYNPHYPLTPAHSPSALLSLSTRFDEPISRRATTPWLALLLLVRLQLRKVGKSNSGLTRLAKARAEKGLTIADITRLTGLSYDNYIKYEREEVEEQYMSIETLNKLSDVLGIDLLTDYHKFKMNSSQIIREYMERNKLSIRKFALICEVSVTTVKNWRNGICSPSYELWEKFFKQ